MIYLNNTTDSQIILVPRVGKMPSGTLVFQLKNTMEQDIKVDVDAIDVETLERYVNIAVELPEGLDGGEYEYSLLKGGIVVSTGIAILPSHSEISQYNKEITYEQYEN